MTADKLAKLIRSGKGKVHVANVELNAEGAKIKGDGWLLIARKQIALHLNVRGKTPMPERQKHIWGESDFWSLKGLIERDLRFSCDRVSPRGRTDHWKLKTRPYTTQVLRLPHIKILPGASDRLTNADRKALGLPRKKPTKWPKVSFEAVLVECPQLFINAGTDTKISNDFLRHAGSGSRADTFIDRADDYDFALIKRRKDLHVHLESRARFRSKNAQDDLRRFESLLEAVGFTHRVHAWPFRLLQWRDGEKVLDQLRAARRVTRSPHAPFDDGLGITVGRHRKGARNSAIRIAARFFDKRDPTSREIARLLFLCRASTAASIDLRVRTLPLCSLFEGIVNLLFDHLQLEQEARAKDPQFDEYVRQRDRLCARLNRFASKNNLALQRLIGSLEHASTFRVRDKFHALCAHFKLATSDMDRHLQSWSAKRNPLSHGKWDSDITDFIHQSRIAGAINIFVLKLMGYSGRIRAVTVGENKAEIYRTI